MVVRCCLMTAPTSKIGAKCQSFHVLMHDWISQRTENKTRHSKRTHHSTPEKDAPTSIQAACLRVESISSKGKDITR